MKKQTHLHLGWPEREHIFCKVLKFMACHFLMLGVLVLYSNISHNASVWTDLACPQVARVALWVRAAGSAGTDGACASPDHCWGWARTSRVPERFWGCTWSADDSWPATHQIRACERSGCFLFVLKLLDNCLKLRMLIKSNYHVSEWNYYILLKCINCS